MTLSRREMAVFVVVAAGSPLLSGCIGDFEILGPTGFCVVSEQSADLRRLPPGEIVPTNDGCSPGEQFLCGRYDDEVFIEESCPD